MMIGQKYEQSTANKSEVQNHFRSFLELYRLQVSLIAFSTF